MSAGHIRQRGRDSWELKYDLPRAADGKRRTRTLTVKGSKADARRELRKMLTAIDEGRHVDRSSVTIGEFVAERIAMWQVGAATRETLQTVAGRLGPIAGIQVQRLTSLDVERWHTVLRERGLSPATIRVAHRLLARALAEAVRHGLTVKNVAREQAPPRIRNGRKVEIVTSEAVPMLLQKLDDDWRVPVVVALYTGARRSEQLALTWADIDLDAATMIINKALEETRAGGVVVKSTKTSAGERTISLPQVVVDALREHRRAYLERCLLLGLGRPSDDALVFPHWGGDGGLRSPRAHSLAWGRAAARLGFPEITWHALRHTHASMLISSGVPITTVAARLGHANPSVTLSIYSHLFTKDDRAAAAAIDKALGQ